MSCHFNCNFVDIDGVDDVMIDIVHSSDSDAAFVRALSYLMCIVHATFNKCSVTVLLTMLLHCWLVGQCRRTVTKQVVRSKCRGMGVGVGLGQVCFVLYLNHSAL